MRIALTYVRAYCPPRPSHRHLASKLDTADPIPRGFPDARGTSAADMSPSRPMCVLREDDQLTRSNAAGCTVVAHVHTAHHSQQHLGYLARPFKVVQARPQLGTGASSLTRSSHDTLSLRMSRCVAQDGTDPIVGSRRATATIMDRTRPPLTRCHPSLSERRPRQPAPREPSPPQSRIRRPCDSRPPRATSVPGPQYVT